MLVLEFRNMYWVISYFGFCVRLKGVDEGKEFGVMRLFVYNIRFYDRVGKWKEDNGK